MNTPRIGDVVRLIGDPDQRGIVKEWRGSNCFVVWWYGRESSEVPATRLHILEWFNPRNKTNWENKRC